MKPFSVAAAAAVALASLSLPGIEAPGATPGVTPGNRQARKRSYWFAKEVGSPNPGAKMAAQYAKRYASLSHRESARKQRKRLARGW